MRLHVSQTRALTSWSKNFEGFQIFWHNLLFANRCIREGKAACFLGFIDDLNSLTGIACHRGYFHFTSKSKFKVMRCQLGQIDFNKNLAQTVIRGHCKVYFIKWPVQNVTGNLLFLSLYRTRSTFFIKQIWTVHEKALFLRLRLKYWVLDDKREKLQLLTSKLSCWMDQKCNFMTNSRTSQDKI